MESTYNSNKHNLIRISRRYSDYYNNNESTRFTLEIQNKEIALETDIAIFVLTRHQDTNFVNLVSDGLRFGIEFFFATRTNFVFKY